MSNKPIERDGFCTTRETAMRLHCTMANVAAMRKKGVLVGEKYDGAWYYSEQEVAEAIRYRTQSKKPLGGELAARVFAHLKANTPDADIIIDLRITTGQLIRFKRQFNPDWWTLSPERTRRLRQLLSEHGLPCQSPEDLEQAIEHLCARETQLCRLELGRLNTG